MNGAEQSATSLIVTTEQIQKWFECSKRMLEYACANEKLLITTVYSQEGAPIRLILDRKCIINREMKPIILDSS